MCNFVAMIKKTIIKQWRYHAVYGGYASGNLLSQDR